MQTSFVFNIIAKYRYNSYMGKKSQMIIDILMLIMKIAIIAHYFACIWHTIGTFEMDNGYDNWIQYYNK